MDNDIFPMSAAKAAENSQQDTLDTDESDFDIDIDVDEMIPGAVGLSTFETYHGQWPRRRDSDLGMFLRLTWRKPSPEHAPPQPGFLARIVQQCSRHPCGLWPALAGS